MLAPRGRYNRKLRMNDVDALARFLSGSTRLLAFTGAGMSTASGIPDFRGPQGIWRTRQPVYFQDFLASEERRVEYWDQKAEAWEAFRLARPNAAHEALVELERRGRLLAVVTQNIDGLHQAAGHAPGRVVEVHGTNREVECLACGARSDPSEAVALFRARRAAPRCACGGWLKFATISFGQPLRPEIFERAAALASECDAALALGSTLSVHPAAGIPWMAARRGVPYAIVNRGATEQDALATLRLDGDVVALLPPALQRLDPDEAG